MLKDGYRHLIEKKARKISEKKKIGGINKIRQISQCGGGERDIYDLRKK